MGRASRWLKGLLGTKNNNPDRPSSDEPKRPSINGLCLSDHVAEAAALRRPPYYYCSEKQSKHSMAVAAAADAALAAARAAVAVVRLIGHATSTPLTAPTTCENAAALIIQTVFRGYLARKALRALKGVVKLQAIVRGHLVRKQAILTLKSMQALIRLQSTTRRSHHAAINNPIDHQTRPYTSMVKFGGAPHTRRQSASSIPQRPIAESINGRRNSPSRRRSSVTSLVDFANSPNCYQTAHSPLPSHFSGYISTPSHFNFLQELHYDEEFRRCSSAQTTPRFANTAQSNDVLRQRSEHGGFVFPSYMANTQSFNAKARSSSAPKQRSSGGRSRVSLNEMMESSRSSFSGVK